MAESILESGGLPDDVPVTADFDGHDLHLSTPDDVLYLTGNNNTADSIAGMVRQCVSLALEQNRETGLDWLDGWKGPLYDLYNRVSAQYKKLCDMNTADYPIPRLHNQYQDGAPDPGPGFTNR